MSHALAYTRADLPEGFVFGTATSAYQIEGHARGGAGRQIWDDFAATPGNVVRGENGALACDHLARWPQDLDLVRDAGFDAYRFSTSWARIMPEGRGAVNAQGLDFYDRLVDGMLERGLKPAATLYHWEMPSALNDLGGWRNRDVAQWFGDFAAIVAARLGDRLWSVAPINEPWCVSWLSHFYGMHAPGLRDIRATARAAHHILLAHGTAVGVLRDHGVGNIGAVCNFEGVRPASPSAADSQAAATYDAIYNRFFLDGLFAGRYPAEALAGLEPHLPAHWQDDFDVIGAPLDWIGLNYYTRKTVGAAAGAWPGLQDHPSPDPKTVMGWEIWPDGLEHFLHHVHAAAPNLPIYVTENGMAAPDELHNGTCDDPHRIAYINAHLAALLRAQAAGVPVAGYFLWSLMDNYEWSEGYKDRFGLVHVDFETLARTPKASWHACAQALKGERQG